MTTNYFYKNTKSKFLEVSGQDSVSFIQNLITNDINKCLENHFLYSSFQEETVCDTWAKL